ncbi:MAG: cyclase family protein [Alphaproteobacteria bacterium]|nr:cyclase family protein [Alphaproteobacteria bacterium]
MAHAGHDHSRWGAADQLGAANFLTAAKRVAALQSVRRGEMFDLSHEIAMGAPYLAPNQTPYLLSMSTNCRDSLRRRRDLGYVNDAGANLERIEMTTHVGTHIDALGHISMGERLYNGRNGAEIVTDRGLESLGVEHIPPIITRALLLDLATADGGAHLGPGRVITPDDLARAVDATGTAIEPGDVVLIRTGWSRYFATDVKRYLDGEPGIDVAGAHWLTRQGVVAIGCDNMAVEVMPNPDPKRILPVHQHALVEAGVYLVENLVLEALAAAGARHFCFLLLATKFRGATGSPVRPVAVL